MLKGVGKDAKTVEEFGGWNSESPYRFDLLPPLAMAAIAEVRKAGAEKYGDWTYLSTSPAGHLSHALAHAFAYIAGDESEKGGDPFEHLKKALCRLAFAVDVIERARAAEDRRQEAQVDRIEIGAAGLEETLKVLDQARHHLAAKCEAAASGGKYVGLDDRG